MQGHQPSEKEGGWGSNSLLVPPSPTRGSHKSPGFFFLSRRKKREREGWCEKEEEERRDGAEVMRIKGIFSSLFPSFLSLE